MGDVGTALLFENDRVKVWEMELAPGESTDLHEHTMDYLLVILEGDRVAAKHPHDPARADIEADIHSGMVAYMKRGGTEVAENIGQRRYREIIIELKD